MSWFWPRGASGSQRDGVVQLVCSSVVRRTRGQPTGGAGIACERCADLQESLLVSYWTLASSRCLMHYETWAARCYACGRSTD